MSYDIYLHPPKPKCDHCNREFSTVYGPDPTYNLSPIFDLALTGESFPNPSVSEGAVVLLREKTDRPRGLRVLSGRLGKDTLVDINAALDRFADEKFQKTFLALQPDNGWGDLPGARRVMEKLKTLAEGYPDYTWEIR
jgi:hypothetical protein